MAQLVAPATVAELRSGDEAVVLFEALPNASGKSAAIAEVELTWKSSFGGVVHTLSHSVSPSEIAASWEHAPPIHRVTALAAESAEQLRGSRAALQSVWRSRDSGATPSLVTELRSLLSSSSTDSSKSAESLRMFIPMLETAAEHRDK